MGIHNRLLRKLLKAASPRAREARLKRFAELMELKPGQRVLDLGGSTGLWRFVHIPLNITILNLEGERIDERQYNGHRFTIVRGDATDVRQFADNSFDLVFSNSCIEHVGPAEKQAAFAREARRLAPAYYVQTPAVTFPIEAHTGLPFWWLYPAGVRNRLIQGWRRRRPGYGEFIDGTRVLRRREIERFFPDATLEAERVLGLTKSHIAWRKPRQSGQIEHAAGRIHSVSER